MDLLTLTNFLPSKSEARRVIQQGGISVNGKKIEDAEVIIDLDSVDNDYILLKKGKKTFLKVCVNRACPGTIVQQRFFNSEGIHVHVPRPEAGLLRFLQEK